MTGVHRYRYRRSQINIAQTQYHVGCLKHNFLHILNGVQSVNPADKFRVTGTPGCIGSCGFLVSFCRKLCLRVVPGKRQMQDTGRHGNVIHIRQGSIHLHYLSAHFRGRNFVHGKMYLQRTDAGCHINNGKVRALQRFHQGMCPETQIQVQLHFPEFHQYIFFTGKTQLVGNAVLCSFCQHRVGGL